MPWVCAVLAQPAYLAPPPSENPGYTPERYVDI